MGARRTMTVFGFLLLLLTGCASTSVGESQSVAQQSSTSSYSLVSEYRIGVDDEVQVNVWRNEELSVTVPVRPDGMISVPLLGDVKAGGLTPQEVANNIRKGLSKYIRDPQVAVILSELRSHEFLSRVRVTGAVRTPISMPYRQGMTVLDAVLEAGGISEFAAANRTKVYRRDASGTKVISIHLNSILTKGELESNVELVPGDVITVPERLF